MTPFKALYDQDPPLLLKLKCTTIPSTVEEVNQMVTECDALLAELHTNLLKAQNRLDSRVDKHRRDVIVMANLFSLSCSLTASVHWP